jgi:hypothetical protein
VNLGFGASGILREVYLLALRFFFEKDSSLGGILKNPEKRARLSWLGGGEREHSRRPKAV